MTEALIRRWLIKKLKNERIKLQPIESGGTGLGIPDLYFRTERSGGWIELKVGKMSKDGELRLRWEPGQLNWIKEHAELNGKTFLFVGVNPDSILITWLDVMCASHTNINDAIIESAYCICSMDPDPIDFISAKHIMNILNS